MSIKSSSRMSSSDWSENTVWYLQNGEKKDCYFERKKPFAQPAIACSKLTLKALEQGVKYVQS